LNEVVQYNNINIVRFTLEMLLMYFIVTNANFKVKNKK